MISSSVTTQNPRLTSAKLYFGGDRAAVKPKKARFNGVEKLSILKKSDKMLDWVGASRTREMLVEDFGGFGVLRTMMDSLRGFFFGTGGLNIPAASERLAREGFSIFTDNILAGISAAGFGKIADRRMKTFSSKWTDFSTLELFQQIIHDQAPRTGSIQASEQAFLKELARQISASRPEQQKACLDLLRNYWKNPTQDRGRLAGLLAKNLGLKSFDLPIGSSTFKLDNLLDDLRIFKAHMASLRIQDGWREAAQKTLAATLKVKNWKMGFVGLGMAATFAVPYSINRATKKIFDIDYYTGEIGLIKDNKSRTPAPGLQNLQQSFGTTTTPFPGAASNIAAYPAYYAAPVYTNQYTAMPRFAQTYPAQPVLASPRPTMPVMAAQPAQPEQGRRLNYVKDALKNGNPWPLLLALIPLPIAAGIFDTVHWKGLKPFSKAWRNALDFSKHAPFTTQQQMAATFALLITSRLLASRSDNEFRERLVDSGLGWLLWILGMPLMKRAIAGYLDRKSGTSLLLKDVPISDAKTRRMLRSVAEVEQLSTYMKDITPEMVAKAQQQLKRLSRGSLFASLILLGIVEPYVAIQWTKYNSRRKAENQIQVSPVNTLPPPGNFQATAPQFIR